VGRWKGQRGRTSSRQIDCLAAITATLAAMSDPERDALRARLAVGLHWGVQRSDEVSRDHAVALSKSRPGCARSVSGTASTRSAMA